MSHAIDGQRLFHRPRDFRRYLGLLQLTVERHDWRLYTFVLMPNHVHLQVAASPNQLSNGLWWLNWQYAEHYKAAYRPRMGHVFSGRPRLKPITTDAYFMAVARYIALNPRQPDDYRWSAHRAIIGAAPPIPFLATEELLGWFGPIGTPERYGRFVSGAESSEHRHVRRWAGACEDRPSLADVVADRSAAAMLEAHDRWDYSLREIGAVLDLHYMVVRRAILREREQGARPRVRGLS